MKKIIKLRLVFMGTSSWAEKILIQLLEKKYNVIAVFTQADKKSGRKQEVSIVPVKKTAKNFKIPVFQPEKWDEQALKIIVNLKPDLIVVADYGKILPKEILELPGFGCLNVHASLLPKYRGASPIQNALLNGDTLTGVSIILMDEKVDTGKILTQKELAIKLDDNYQSLSLKLSELGGNLLTETIPLWINKKIIPQKQDENQATLCQLIEKDDGRIFWNESAKNIYNRFRAFSSWPGVFTFWENKGIKRIKLTALSFLFNSQSKERATGEVFRTENGIAVQTAKGIIFLKRVQMEGKKETDIENFINGYPNFLGAILK